MFFIGIDEAGYGPILGPLVVGGVMLRCSGEPDPGILWQGLADAIAAKPRKRDPRLVVCDSKVLSRRPDGLGLLEKAALVPARLAGLPTDTWRGFVHALDPEAAGFLSQAPWYADGDLPLPCACEPEVLTIQASVVRAAALRRGCAVAAVAASVLPASRYNFLLSKCDNKSVVLWMATTWVLARLLRVAAQLEPGERVLAVLDRHGGRSDYRASLQRSFEPADLAVLEKAPGCSRYRMTIAPGDGGAGSGGPPQFVELRFIQEADGTCGPTAWASCVAKYTREICMLRLNEWFQARVSGLERTAGYLPDGRRFAEQVTPHLARLNVEPERLIRRR